MEPVSVCLKSRESVNVTRINGSGLPEGVDNSTLLSTDVVVVPVPGFGIDRFADTAEHPQTGQVVTLDMVSTQTTE
jgi:hypothetical protein